MIDAEKLLDDLQRVVRKLEDDMRARLDERADLDAALRDEYDAARRAERTSAAYTVFRDERITQAAVAWVLGCVFVRFLEDNGLVDGAWMSGPADRLRLARDRHTLYFKEHPTHSDREYLEHVFRETAKLPGAAGLFDARHNPLWRVGPSGDGATMLLGFWQQVVPETGALVHDFTDPEWNTRFLGDLYQDLSEAARKKYALLQTPDFVEEFILDRTLDPAVEEFGYREVRLIDPACGSGHFLLGAFRRLFALREKHEPSVANRALHAQQALDQVHGVDVNPFAAAIARFRLLIAALRASGIARLASAPDFTINVTAGDSLLHGVKGQVQMAWSPIAHVYETEDRDELERILRPGHYHAVVGNPPYITPKDAALNAAYRSHFGSCHMKYSLAVPFMERFFDLAIDGERAGFVGMITANSFMKREFGKKLIESYIPRWDLTHVIDTSGAYIPGHGTPTVILLGRHRVPVGETVRAVLGIKGEPSTPEDPSHGFVWSSIVALVDRPGEASEFVSVADMPREGFHKHPWSIGGGGAAELKELIEERATERLGDIATAIGITSVTGEDDLYTYPGLGSVKRLGIELSRPLVTGDVIRDWRVGDPLQAVWLYDDDFNLLWLDEVPKTKQLFWRYRSAINKRKRFGTPMVERGLSWYEWQELYADKLRTPLSITFAFVATHNHFVLDRGGKVFKQSAPVIKLPEGATEEDHLALLGLLNSSTGCFWMQQVCHNKGGPGGASSKDEKWHDFYEHDGTKLKAFPIPESTNRLLPLARELAHTADELSAVQPVALCRERVPTRDVLSEGRQLYTHYRRRLVALQEELDWLVYELYGLLDRSEQVTSPPGDSFGVNPGERAFEIDFARKVEAGTETTKWFDTLGAEMHTEVPGEWPSSYSTIIENRLRLLKDSTGVRLIEQFNYKRRWEAEPWESQQERALREWLLDRLEDPRYWPDAELTSTAKLADRAKQDSEFMQVAEIYRERADFDVAKLVAELVAAESVPFLPVLRYKDSGLRKRAEWERTWELQRREDAVDARVELPEGDPNRLTKEQAEALKKSEIGDIPVPPKYASADFKSSTFWRLRGKLDVPKERFVSYPHCEREADTSLPVAWAGWDHLQQARALAAYYERMRTEEGWSADRLTPLLAGILELVPWLLQWHNDFDPAYGTGLGDFFKGFVEEEARAMGKTLDDLRAWSPAETPRRRRRATM